MAPFTPLLTQLKSGRQALLHHRHSKQQQQIGEKNKAGKQRHPIAEQGKRGG